jgi:hypothetical protein
MKAKNLNYKFSKTECGKIPSSTTIKKRLAKLLCWLSYYMHSNFILLVTYADYCSTWPPALSMHSLAGFATELVFRVPSGLFGTRLATVMTHRRSSSLVCDFSWYTSSLTYQQKKKSKGHSSNCAATYNVELRQLSLFHGTISHVLRN